MSDLSISVQSFYGADNKYKSSIFDAECIGSSAGYLLPANLTRILGPSNVWKIFRKQSELLDYLSLKANNLNLMPFVFQSINNERLFLAAHPLVFWHYDIHRKPDQRHSYEIIRENRPCKLYFDLEFNILANPNHNGVRMIRTFESIIFFMLKLDCTPDVVLDLDSSTESKFSHHLIFQLPNQVFQDNHHAGFFVEQVCAAILANVKGDNIAVELKNNCKLSAEELSELLVLDDKGNSVLFCDRSVYSKNRHFRLYKSSKLGKKTPLVLSGTNKFRVSNSLSDAHHDELMFLASLITFFPDGNFLGNSEILSFDTPASGNPTLCLQRRSDITSRVTAKAVSAYPKLDKFIQSMVVPGKVWRVLYFDTNKTLVYDIVGNRFCQNIGREHKSNNIMIVVDTQNCVYYQKCHDFDCRGFKSNELKLPYELCFYFDSESDNLTQSNEDDLKLLDDDYSFEDLSQISQTDQKSSNLNEGANMNQSVPQKTLSTLCEASEAEVTTACSSECKEIMRVGPSKQSSQIPVIFNAQQHKAEIVPENVIDSMYDNYETLMSSRSEKSTNSSVIFDKESEATFSDKELETEMCQLLDILEDESILIEDSDFNENSDKI